MDPYSNDPNFNNVSLLLRMNGVAGSTTFTDSSNNNFALSAFGDAQISTSVKKYGDGSAYFDGDGDYLQTVIPNWNPGVGGEPFTIEFWAYRLNTSTHVFLTKHGGVAAWNETNGINFHFYATSSNLIFGFYGGSEISINNSTAIPDNQWVHLAVTYDGTTTRIFVDGALQPVTSTTSYQTVTNANILQIAGEVNDSFPMNGYIDDLRITKGIARYTANFTPPGQSKIYFKKRGDKKISFL